MTRRKITTIERSKNGTGARLDVPGAILAGLWKRIECPFPVEEGSPPLWAEIRIDFDFDTHDRILALTGGGKAPSYADVFPLVAPFVRAWNATAVDVATGERVNVPPPIEGGTASLRTQSPIVTMWLLGELRMAPFGDADRPKGSTASASTPES